MLKHRVVLLSISFISLTFGLLIYVLGRSETYIHDYLSVVLNIKFPIATNIFSSVFIKYYLVDFLWAFSLSFSLLSVSFKINTKSIILISTISSLCGIAFEFFQLINVLNGTFDFLDMVMYATASILFAVININIKKGVKI